MAHVLHAYLCMFVCICVRMAGVEQNGEVFRENKGTSCTLSLIRYSTPRRMALKVMRQLILLDSKCLEVDLCTHLTSELELCVKNNVCQAELVE